MKRLRFAFAALIVSAAIAAHPAAAFAETGFTDVRDNYWAVPYIGLAKETGLIEGYAAADGTAEFRPEKNVTKQECMVMLYNTLKLAGALSSGEDLSPELGEFYEPMTPPLTGEPLGIPQWARIYVSYGLAEGICDPEDFYTDADADGRSGGYSYASRQLIAKWTARALGCETEVFFPVVYSDAGDCPAEFLPYIDSLYRHGIMQGNKGAFYPLNGVRRSEMAAVCVRLLGVVVDEEKGEITSRGMVREDGTVAEGAVLYDRSEYSEGLSLGERMTRLQGTLISLSEDGSLVFEAAEGEKNFILTDDARVILDGAPLSLEELSELAPFGCTLSYYQGGEGAVILQTGPFVWSGVIKKVHRSGDHTGIVIEADEYTADFVITDVSVFDGRLTKNRSCRFISDGIEILEMR